MWEQGTGREMWWKTETRRARSRDRGRKERKRKRERKEKAWGRKGKPGVIKKTWERASKRGRNGCPLEGGKE